MAKNSRERSRIKSLRKPRERAVREKIDLFPYITESVTLAFAGLIYILNQTRLYFLKVFEKPIEAVVDGFFLFLKLLDTVFISFFRKLKVFKNDVRIHLEQKHRRPIGKAELFFATIRYGFLSDKKSFVKTFFNYLCPIAAIALLVTTVNYVSSLNLLVAVEYKDTTIGYVENESQYKKAEAMLLERTTLIKNQSQNAKPTGTLAVSFIDENDNPISNLLGWKKKTTVDEEEIEDTEQSEEKVIADLADNMIKSAGENISSGVGVFLDSRFVGAVSDDNEIKMTLKNILTKNENKKLSFVNDISFKKGYYMNDTLISTKTMKEKLTGTTAKVVKYKTKKGDSSKAIAKRFDMTLAQLLKLNPNIKKNPKANQTLKVHRHEPVLSVKEVKQISEKVPVNYSTVYVKNSEELKGTERLEKNGVVGVRRVVSQVEILNNQIISKETVSTKILKAPTPRRVSVGTKVISAGRGAASFTNGNTGFIWPVKGGYMSSRYGPRGNQFHKGQDIAAPAGTPVYASKSGKVTTAGWYSGYGKCVIIDHGNGLTTLYAHNSAIYVTVGQEVAQGHNIAGVGTTGWSTGNHCHFEIAYNGVKTDPYPLIGGRAP